MTDKEKIDMMEDFISKIPDYIRRFATEGYHNQHIADMFLTLAGNVEKQERRLLFAMDPPDLSWCTSYEE